MAVPKKKTSKARKHRRHSARQSEKIRYWLNKINITRSKEGNDHKLAHTVCPTSGYYKGKQVRTIKAKTKGSVVDAD